MTLRDFRDCSEVGFKLSITRPSNQEFSHDNNHEGHGRPVIKTSDQNILLELLVKGKVLWKPTEVTFGRVAGFEPWCVKDFVVNAGTH